MSIVRRTALASATASILLAAAAAPSALAAGGPTSPPTKGLLPTLPVISSLPVVGGLLGGGATAPTTLPTIPGLEILNTVLSSVPIVGGTDPASALGGLPALPIDSGLLAGLSGGGSDPFSSIVASLTSLTGTLPVGGLPTDTVPIGSALSPATALLRMVAGAAAGTPLSSALTALADQVDAAGENGLSPDLTSVLASTLGSIAKTDGIPAPVQNAAGALATALSPAPSTTGTTTPNPKPTTTTTPKPATTTTVPGGTAAKAPVKLGRVRISSLKIDRAKGTVTVALTCPANGPACLTIVTAYRGSALAGSLPLTYIASGSTVKKKIRFNSASRRALARRTTTFKVGALLQGGVASKSVTTKLPKKKVVKKQAAKR